MHTFLLSCLLFHFSFFFFNDTATTEIYTLSLHDALPIFIHLGFGEASVPLHPKLRAALSAHARSTSYAPVLDRKSTRLNSSHSSISYAVFCLKKKKNKKNIHTNKIYILEHYNMTSISLLV